MIHIVLALGWLFCASRWRGTGDSLHFCTAIICSSIWMATA